MTISKETQAMWLSRYSRIMRSIRLMRNLTRQRDKESKVRFAHHHWHVNCVRSSSEMQHWLPAVSAHAALLASRATWHRVINYPIAEQASALLQLARNRTSLSKISFQTMLLTKLLNGSIGKGSARWPQRILRSTHSKIQTSWVTSVSNSWLRLSKRSPREKERETKGNPAVASLALMEGCRIKTCLRMLQTRQVIPISSREWATSSSMILKSTLGLSLILSRGGE